VHGDLHPWNAVVAPHGIRLIDWSDAAVAHPFVELATVLWEPMADAERAAIVDAYLEPWAGLLAPGELREAAHLGEIAGCLFQAISYREITNALEPSDRGLSAHYERSWVERAENLGKALQPG
jgi:thiamine kinase-like enzyme